MRSLLLVGSSGFLQRGCGEGEGRTAGPVPSLLQLSANKSRKASPNPTTPTHVGGRLIGLTDRDLTTSGRTSTKTKAQTFFIFFIDQAMEDTFGSALVSYCVFMPLSPPSSPSPLRPLALRRLSLVFSLAASPSPRRQPSYTHRTEDSKAVISAFSVAFTPELASSCLNPLFYLVRGPQGGGRRRGGWTRAWEGRGRSQRRSGRGLKGRVRDRPSNS